MAPLTLLPTSSTPLTITPSNVPLCTTSAAPSVVLIVPPRIVPPCRVQKPLAALSASVLFVLFSEPVKYTAPLVPFR